MSKSRTGGNGSRAWVERSAELARWALAWVNRTDVWGGYRTPHERGREFTWPDGSTGRLGAQTTRPAPSKRGRILLTEAVLTRHFAGRSIADLVGLHSTSPENTSRWAGPDIDWHGEGSSDPEANLAAGLAWYEKLRGLGFRPLLTESNGKGGYHLLALFNEPVPTPLVFAFARWLVADHAEHGLSARPETFPKQPHIAAGQYGNWLRLPGRHHTREHWSRVWDGSSWREGTEAVAHILTLTGDSPKLIPSQITAPPPRPEPMPQTGTAPRDWSAPGFADGRLARRVGAYLAKQPNLGEGQGRDDVAYRVAAFLVRDLALSDDAALAWLRVWDAGNRPPKGDDRLREILASAHHYGQREYGAGLSAAPAPRPLSVPRWRPRHQPSITFHIEV
jgi:hypothetical protein